VVHTKTDNADVI